MGTLTAPKLMTEEEFEALPDDGMDRMLIQGVLWEKPMTLRNPDHSRVLILLGYHLHHWLRQQPKPRGRILGGEAGFRLRNDPPTRAGIDVAYISPELAAATPRGARIVDGVPVLAAEILSPSVTQEEIDAKVEEYHQVGVAVVWLLNPKNRTVLVHRRDAEPELFNRLQELHGDPDLPGFKVAVAELFED